MTQYRHICIVAPKYFGKKILSIFANNYKSINVLIIKESKSFPLKRSCRVEFPNEIGKSVSGSNPAVSGF
jgi:hypothetical protein